MFEIYAELDDAIKEALSKHDTVEYRLYLRRIEVTDSSYLRKFEIRMQAPTFKILLYAVNTIQELVEEREFDYKLDIYQDEGGAAFMIENSYKG